MWAITPSLLKKGFAGYCYPRPSWVGNSLDANHPGTGFGSGPDPAFFRVRPLPWKAHGFLGLRAQITEQHCFPCAKGKKPGLQNGPFSEWGSGWCRDKSLRKNPGKHDLTCVYVKRADNQQTSKSQQIIRHIYIYIYYIFDICIYLRTISRKSCPGSLWATPWESIL